MSLPLYFCFIVQFYIYSYLKTLVSTFNATITSVIDELRPLADGKTVVPLKKYIHNITLEIISKVTYYVN